MAIADEEIEDGTGITGAIVYESPDDVAAWLSRRGKTRFSSSAADAQESSLINATQAIESEFSIHFRGLRRRSTQGLLWPAVGAFNYRGEEYNYNEIPETYLVGIRLACEEVATYGSLFKDKDKSQWKRFKAGPAEVEFSDTHNYTRISIVHPDIWRHVLQALPGYAP